MKWFVLVLGLLLVLPGVVALDKDLFNVSNCFNLTVEPVLVSGNESLGGVGFSGCSKQSDGVWFCNCYRGDGGSFRLVMQSDGTILREPRVYSLRLRVNYFSFKVSRQSVTVEDWGDYVDREGLEDAVVDFNFKKAPLEFVVVNHTVEVMRNVTVFEDRIVYQDRPVEVVRNVSVNVFWENTSRVVQLEDELLNTSKYFNDVLVSNKIKMWVYLLLASLFWILVMFVVIFFIVRNKNG